MADNVFLALAFYLFFLLYILFYADEALMNCLLTIIFQLSVARLMLHSQSEQVGRLVVASRQSTRIGNVVCYDYVVVVVIVKKL